ncbi:hypothetical protein K438DRAFT_1872653 [Mycena galopus ATCC 62051]|nr:hypothetical protein K438DRAFT_1872653 [Mycena galopus ATCC 62051]
MVALMSAWERDEMVTTIRLGARMDRPMLCKRTRMLSRILDTADSSWWGGWSMGRRRCQHRSCRQMQTGKRWRSPWGEDGASSRCTYSPAPISAADL